MDLNKVFRSFENLNVMIVGDLMLDRYLTGRVSRISPEAPVPVVEWGGEEDRLGGAANVALNVLALGAKPVLCGMVGQDAESTVLLDLLPSFGLEDSVIVTSAERVTTVKTRVMAGNQHLLRLDKEQTNDLSLAEESKFLGSVARLFETRKFHVLILQDYNKGVLSKPVISRLLSEARQRGIPVAVDPKFKNFWAYREVELFKPNLKEVGDALRMTVATDFSALRQVAATLRQKLSNRYTLITLSEKGAYLDDGQSGQLYPTHPRTVADVSGAGDTVISIAALAVALGLGMEEIALLSNLAGGQVVEKPGVVPVDKNQLRQEILQLYLNPER